MMIGAYLLSECEDSEKKENTESYSLLAIRKPAPTVAVIPDA